MRTLTGRVSRVESKSRTREDLLVAARRVFVERGFHSAALDEIAEAAGYTKGAVYSNFAGKDDLFLAVLEDHYAGRARSYAGLVLAGESFEETVRAVSRFMVHSYVADPAWWPLISEFAMHASRKPELAEAFRNARERFLDAVADVIASLGDRHGVAFRLPPREVARGSGALMRGMVVEWLIDPSAPKVDAFEELHVAYMRGLVVSPQERSTG